MDGYLMIGTEIDTKEFDSQIKYIETKLEEIEYQLKQADMGFEVGDTVKLEAQYEKLTNQLIKLKQKQEDLNKVDLSNIGKSTSKVIKQIGKWALAVFGVRAAYGFVRNSINTLSQYNKQLASDLEYIRFAIASSLEPLIEKIVSLVYRLLNYLNYIAQAWFGVNLFANASAEAMNKSAKSAKDMKKSLTGFDEMNVVSSSSSSSSSSTTPSVDLSGIQGEVPIWIKWIGENKEIVIGALLGIAGGLLAIQLGLTNLQGLGIGLIIAGLTIAIQGLVEFIKDPSWNNFLTILQGIALVVAGIAVLVSGWTVALIALGVAIVSYVIQNWDNIKKILGVVGTWIYENIISPVADFFVNLWNNIKNGAISFWEGTKNVFSTIGNWIYTNIIKPVSDFFVGLWNGIVSGVTTAVSTVKNIFNSVVNFFKNIISTIVGLFKNIGTKVGDVIGTAFKNVINSVLNAIENILNFPIKSINKLLDVINKIPGINLSKLQTFSLPRLKSGGIINMPGKGIPIGGAIGGEVGREGVIPLTDSQAMEELGSAIGRYITINLTNNTNLDGRTILRQQSKVQANRNFAMNR